MAKMALEADGNIVGESFIIQPEKNLAAKLGVLFGVIEIYNANDAFLDGFLSAVSDLKTEYYLPPFSAEKSVEKRFEEAISRANRRIFAAINQSIEEIDLRNISAAVGLFHGNKIYLSSAGRLKGLFYRRKKNGEILIIDILSGNGESRFRPEAEKIFANILSGELTKRDALLLINEEFLGVFSQKELGETVLDHSAAEALKIIDSSLREKVTKKNYYSIAIAQAPEAEAETKIEAPLDQAVSTRPFRGPAADSLPTGQIKTRIDPDTQPRPAPRKTVPTQQSLDNLLYTQVRTEKYLIPSLLPQWQKILLVIWNTAKRSFFYLGRQIKKTGSAGWRMIADWQRKSSAAKGKIKEKIASEPEQLEETGGDRREAMEPKNGSRTELAAKPAKLPPAEKNLPAGAAEKINYFLNSQIEKFLALKKGQQIILAVGLILIFLFSQSVVMIGRTSDEPQSSSANGDIAKQIEVQLDNAEALNIFNDEIGAMEAIKKARELLAQIPDKRLNKSFKSGQQAKINEAAGKLQKISYLDSPKIAADFSAGGTQSELAGLARTGKIFWAFDNPSQTLYRLDPADGKISLVTTTLKQINKLAAIDDKNLILLAETKTYYKFEIAKRTAAKTNPSKNYFQTKLPAAASPFIDPPLASSTIAMSVTSETYLFFLDGEHGRVVALDKNGILKGQYYSESFKGAGSLAVAYKEKKLWVYNAGKAYEIDLNF